MRPPLRVPPPASSKASERDALNVPEARGSEETRQAVGREIQESSEDVIDLEMDPDLREAIAAGAGSDEESAKSCASGLSKGSTGDAEHRSDYPTIGPDLHSSASKIHLRRSVEKKHQWKVREAWLDKAHGFEAPGQYSQSDTYLLNWIMCGDCGCFDDGWKGSEGEQRFQEV